MNLHPLEQMLNLNLVGDVEGARAISDQLEMLGPDIWARHSFNRGWFLLRDGDYQRGCQLLEHGRAINAYGAPRLSTSAPIYNPAQHDIRGKRVIIALEGGLGDEIVSARFATSFARLGATVHLACDPGLASLLRRIDGVASTIARADVHTVPHDYWIPGFSAGWLAGHTFDSFPGAPYLTPDRDRVEALAGVIRRGPLRVGIRWSGNPQFEHHQHRKFPVEPLLELRSISGVALHSLQRDHDLVALPPGVRDLLPFMGDWEGTAAAIANLDLVVSSCTSVAHLAAAMGVETHVIVPVLPYHTWATGAPESTTTPYYRSVRLHRQLRYGDWLAPLDSVRAYVARRAETVRAA